MTPEKIEEIKDLLQKKVNVLAPKRLNYVDEIKIISLEFTKEREFREASFDATIKVKYNFGNKNVPYQVIDDTVLKANRLVKNLIIAITGVSQVYVFYP